MTTLKNHATRSIKEHFRNNLAQTSFSGSNLVKNYRRQRKEQRTMMEMWDYYLKFTRFEF